MNERSPADYLFGKNNNERIRDIFIKGYVETEKSKEVLDAISEPVTYDMLREIKALANIGANDIEFHDCYAGIFLVDGNYYHRGCLLDRFLCLLESAYPEYFVFPTQPVLGIRMKRRDEATKNYHWDKEMFEKRNNNR